MKNIKKLLGVFMLAIVFGLCFGLNNVKAEEEMSDEFKSYLTDEEEPKFEIKSTFPKNEDDFMVKIIACMFNEHANGRNIGLADYSEDFTKIDLIINLDEDDEETHTVDIKWAYDEEIEKEINDLISEEEKTNDEITINDMDMINHYYYRDKYDYMEKSGYKIYFINSFSTMEKAVVDNKNIFFRTVSFFAGEEDGLKSQVIGGVAWYEYDNTIYTTYEQAILWDIDHIFYVPSDTPDNSDDIRNAAQKRINDYLGNENVKITNISNVKTVKDFLLGSNYESIEDYLQSLYYDTFEEAIQREYDLEGISESDYIYNVEITLGENQVTTFNMIIKRDSTKMINSSKNVDFMTGIEVNTDRPIIPDTIINVSKLTSGSEYEGIIKLLNLTDSVTYDINLYSKILDKYITELKDGTFEVKIPIPEKLQGKDLTVYYVTDDGKIEEYEVTIKDGYAIFRTTHFSIYTLGYKNDSNNSANIENPKTFDNIGNTIIIGFISLIGLVCITLYLKKEVIKSN